MTETHTPKIDMSQDSKLAAFLEDAIRRGTEKQSDLTEKAGQAGHSRAKVKTCLAAMTAAGQIRQTRLDSKGGRPAIGYELEGTTDEEFLARRLAAGRERTNGTEQAPRLAIEPDVKSAMPPSPCPSANRVQEPSTAPPHPAHRRVEMRDVGSLQVHPRNAEIVPPISSVAREALKAAIAREGILTPLAITSDDFVLCGAERLKLAIEGGIKQVPVIVQHDLTTTAAQVVEIILDNLRRKDFREAQKVRLTMRLAEALKQVGPGEKSALGSVKSDGGTVGSREWLAAFADLSTGGWSKAQAVLTAFDDGSAPVGQLYEEGVLSLDAAFRAKDLPVSEQVQISAEVAAHDRDDRRRVARALVSKHTKSITSQPSEPTPNDVVVTSTGTGDPDPPGPQPTTEVADSPPSPIHPTVNVVPSTPLDNDPAVRGVRRVHAASTGLPVPFSMPEAPSSEGPAVKSAAISKVSRPASSASSTQAVSQLSKHLGVIAHIGADKAQVQVIAGGLNTLDAQGEHASVEHVFALFGKIAEFATELRATRKKNERRSSTQKARGRKRADRPGRSGRGRR
jgi:hypothetical protein